MPRIIGRVLIVSDARSVAWSHPAMLPAAVGAAFLVIAIAPLPYGYYTFLRIAVTVIAIGVAVISARNQKTGWIWAAAPIALLWNPIFPVYLSRQAWAPIDVFAALALLACGIGIRLPQGAAKKNDVQ